MIDTWERAATRIETPCGDGTAAWRLWGAGPTVLLLHGGAGSWLHWLRTLPALAPRFRVVAPDIPGLGDSALPPGAEPGPEDCARELAAGLDAALGAGVPVHLVGFSFGANVAGQLAARIGARARSLTLVGAASLGLPHPKLDLLKVRALDGAARAAANAENLRRLMIHDPARVDALALEIQDRNVRLARLRSAPHAPGDSLRRALWGTHAPLAGIWGERDQVAFPAVEARLEVIRARDPAAITRVIAGAGHWVMHEAPEAFSAALLTVLDAREPPAARAAPAPTARR